MRFCASSASEMRATFSSVTTSAESFRSISASRSSFASRKAPNAPRKSSNASFRSRIADRLRLRGNLRPRVIAAAQLSFHASFSSCSKLIAARALPSPLRGGAGGGVAPRSLARWSYPLPSPPPQGGEGARRIVRVAAPHRFELIRPPAAFTAAHPRRRQHRETSPPTPPKDRSRSECRTPLFASVRPRTVRNPIDSPSIAPARISASTSRALATSAHQPPAHEEPARVLAHLRPHADRRRRIVLKEHADARRPALPDRSS